MLLSILTVLSVGSVGFLGFVLLRKPAVAPAGASKRMMPVAPESVPPALAYTPEPLGHPMEGNPVITHVRIADLDGDALMDVLVCDAVRHIVGWIRQDPRGVFKELSIGEAVPGPCTPSHVIATATVDWTCWSPAWAWYCPTTIVIPRCRRQLRKHFVRRRKFRMGRAQRAQSLSRVLG